MNSIMKSKKRLIDAGDLWSDIMMLPHNGDMISSEEVEQAIEDAQTVEAVEVVHGEWSTIEDDYCGMIALECSVCNAQWWFEDDVSFGKYHYCPNCGAKMDGGNDDGC